MERMTAPDDSWREHGEGTENLGHVPIPGQQELSDWRESLLTDQERALVANPRYSPAFRAELERELRQIRADHARLTGEMERSRLQALDRLRDVASTLAETREELDRAVERARGMQATWQQIADATGMTRQSAWRRWHRPDETEEPA